MKLSLKDKILLSPLWFLSLLPLPVLQLVSYVLYLLNYYIIGYRKKVVINNIRNSFPEKSDEEIKIIVRRFYLHLCDTFIDTIIPLTRSSKRMQKYYKCVNTEVFDPYYKQNKSVIMATSHYANWEWLSLVCQHIPQKTVGIYKPLTNVRFDRLFIYLRTKFGGLVSPMKKTLRCVVESRNNNRLIALYLIGDQRPLLSEIQYWTTFLNQDTPVLTGIEKLAKKFDLPVVFINIERTKRNKYIFNFELITDKPKETKEYEITEQYFKLVEKQIKFAPEFYLWTHKRWKHKRTTPNIK